MNSLLGAFIILLKKKTHTHTQKQNKSRRDLPGHNTQQASFSLRCREKKIHTHTHDIFLLVLLPSLALNCEEKNNIHRYPAMFHQSSPVPGFVYIVTSSAGSVGGSPPLFARDVREGWFCLARPPSRPQVKRRPPGACLYAWLPGWLVITGWAQALVIGGRGEGRGMSDSGQWSYIG